jgi:hypothetical protein
LGRARFQPGDIDPGTEYWRCPACRAVNGVLADELPWWRWKISMRRLKQMQVDWLTVPAMAALDEWVAELSDAVMIRGNA